MRRSIVALTLLFVGVVFVPGLLAQAAAVVTGGAASPTAGQASEPVAGIVWAFLSTSALEWIKRKPALSMMSEKTTFWTQRVVGFGLAAATAAGVHFSFEWDAANGAATLHATGLAASSIFGALGEILRQWVFNEVTYRVAVKHYGRSD